MENETRPMQTLLTPKRLTLQRLQRNALLSAKVQRTLSNPISTYHFKHSDINMHSAKRYERLMKAHGISPNGSPSKPTTTRATKIERRNSTSPTKKRKAEVFIGDQDDGDDDEEVGMVKKEENANSLQSFQIKEEDSQQHLSFSTANDMAPPNSLHYGQSAYTPASIDYSPAGFSTSIYSNYIVDTKSPYNFGSPYSTNSFAQATHTSTQAFGYQQNTQLPSENQARSESPLIVE